MAVHYRDGVLCALDQTRLPWAEVELELCDAEAVAGAIARLAIRGAPLIGVAAAYGVALAAAGDGQDLERACAVLTGARPTAVNLSYAVNRVRGAVKLGPPEAAAESALAEARAIEAEEVAASRAMAAHGADWLAGRRRILTHCNTGALAAPGRGTALGVIAELADRDGLDVVLACESRPLLQGARLTVYELERLGIDHELIVDSAAAGLMAASQVDAVVVGCDRVAANGDVANKVGTYSHALAAAAASIPFVVVGPCSTVDRHCPSGAAIEIEYREPGEVLGASSGPSGDRAPLAPHGTPVRNPAFDVTPAGLISALITERGVVGPAAGESVLDLL